MEKTKTLTTRRLVVTAMLVALNIVLVRYLGVTTDLVKVNFGFLALSTVAILYGPLWGGCSYALADILGTLLNSSGGTYFFPFTVSEFLYGVVYGLLLHNREKSLRNVIIAVVLTTLVINLGLTPLWNVLYVRIFLGKTLSYGAVWLTKVVPALIMTPIKILSIYLLWKYAGSSMIKYSR